MNPLASMISGRVSRKEVKFPVVCEGTEARWYITTRIIRMFPVFRSQTNLADSVLYLEIVNGDLRILRY